MTRTQEDWTAAPACMKFEAVGAAVAWSIDDRHERVPLSSLAFLYPQQSSRPLGPGLPLVVPHEVTARRVAAGWLAIGRITASTTTADGNHGCLACLSPLCRYQELPTYLASRNFDRPGQTLDHARAGADLGGDDDRSFAIGGLPNGINRV